MRARNWLASVALMFCAGVAQAIPIQVTHTFHDVTWDHEGRADSLGFGQVISGDWVFKGIFDSEATNEFTFKDIGGSYALDSITLTQASLGLVDEPILNLGYLSFFFNRVGFNFGVESLVYPLVVSTRPEQFIGPNPFVGGYGPTTVAGGSLRVYDEGFQFGNGSRIFGFGSAGSSTIAAAVAPVPEPETWLAMMAGLGVLVGRFAKKRAASSQPAAA